MKTRKIGLLGGTFNPIHNGHLMLAEHAYSVYGLDEVWIMPSGVSYQKKADQVLPAIQRIEMIRLAIQGNPHLQLCEIETARAGNTYTSDTLEQLHNDMPDAEFYFILGADNLYGIEKWKDAERIFMHCSILAAGRDHIEIDKLTAQAEYLRQKYQAKITLMQTPNIDLSSEMIRDYIAHGTSVRYLLQDEVIAYIEQHHLFRG
ncbi:MAG: nicotinate-nucleotide adenylyltransferase [bacterium]|nr:nicotinate-nucleotide adenylyltransferase [bacterium]